MVETLKIEIFYTEYRNHVMKYRDSTNHTSMVAKPVICETQILRFCKCRT